MVKKNTFFANKNLGQNFLVDSEVINRIINVINPKSHDFMIEIGPGLGALTYPICKILHKLFVIEHDNNLGTRLLKDISNIEVFVEDVLKFNFLNLINNSFKSVRIIGNLPYNISIPILFYLFKFHNNIIDMNFMFQKEVASKLLAIPGTKSYSRLSIIAQYYCDIDFLFDVVAQSFYPIPKVTSSFVRLVPRKVFNLYVRDINQLSNVTALAFQQRRKIVKNSLSSLFNDDALRKLGIDPLLRAENLSVKQYCLLSNHVC
ncbi:dimethyladenosine transferase [Buchnera aphidicola str. Bp (Baizongia pistaciae)]|uniref:Ribosomal RNA small subunit methyltransferase A n=1 Tax=Buchnera aphidicola subsp. Baizongia pistaciae (strain Bp) TaxID=224915 RepID=RSMA_BUCBP|nr:16S rRNA (adenine(1518)-N(6)/adenine(1519)-N(6))-dimethyltransferase RsmA [Buchnera aphidicola]P59524.1 RecName: Full=Ribosomal RNA small subunit methyltransferase A; AltName: Full=16S rRNA (adenine(1518)-N(6)/adenine(1519)-N(6))-dimethyltransferase; AltName: Full=16S rRNA dimethyladenosine transferase; AltName: Full=16S rRNA dimethylase; AltName: Full=S-adenosylmethionine-6-N', N'-adenosyl(rRNA) dimethyltransferase [Buchnera aphidicola str. Bp (Baizongia pistaciae)]AAO26865.1 dimethyladenosin